MGLTDFGNMENTTKGIESTTKAVGAAMRQLSVAEMISSIATGIAKAQSQLDANGIAQFKAMADPANSIEVAGQKYNLIQLGFAPHFYHFQKITIEVSFDLKFHFDETQSVSLGAKLDLGASIGGSRTTELAAADEAPAAKSAAEALKALNDAKAKVAAAKTTVDQKLGKTLATETEVEAELQRLQSSANQADKDKYAAAKPAVDAWRAALGEQRAAQAEFDRVAADVIKALNDAKAKTAAAKTALDQKLGKTLATAAEIEAELQRLQSSTVQADKDKYAAAKPAFDAWKLATGEQARAQAEYDKLQ